MAVIYSLILMAAIYSQHVFRPFTKQVASRQIKGWFTRSKFLERTDSELIQLPQSFSQIFQKFEFTYANMPGSQKL
jgi:hypothetical protein